MSATAAAGRERPLAPGVGTGAGTTVRRIASVKRLCVPAGALLAALAGAAGLVTLRVGKASAVVVRTGGAVAAAAETGAADDRGPCGGERGRGPW